MISDPALAIATRRRLVLRPWRVSFILFALALETATHWPKLVLPPQSPGSDKTMHFASFLVLAVLLWRTQWIRRRWLVAIIAMAWAVLNEVSQGLPGINRWVTPADAVANVSGVFTACIWMWALAPLGGEANHRRLGRQHFLFEETFRDARVWELGIAGAIIGAAAAALVWQLAPADVTRWFIIMMLLAAIAHGLWQVQRRWRAETMRAEAEQPCFRCGFSLRKACAAPAIDYGFAVTAVHCPQCGAEAECGQWRRAPEPTVREWLGMVRLPIIMGALVIVAVFAGLWFLPKLYAQAISSARTAGATARVTSALSPIDDTVSVVDLALLLSLMGLMAYIYRRRLAVKYDQGRRCRSCGHDLHATPVSDGVGRCGECGTAFLRELK